MKSLVNVRSLMACLALAATLTPVAGAQVRPSFYGQPELNRINGVKIESDVEPILTRLADLAEVGEDWRETALAAGLEVEAGAVVAEVTLDTPAVGFNPDLGLLKVIHVMRHEKRDPTMGAQSESARVLLNPSDLRRIRMELSQLQGTVRITAYRPPVANSYGGAVGEGLEAMRADRYHRADLVGNGVRLAVIDIGFGGIDDPAFQKPGGVERMPSQLDLGQDKYSHGASMIELIRDIAPKAELKAYRLDARMDIMTAVHDAIDSKVDIIVCPLSWFELPGRGAAARAARVAMNHGIRWVNAAGNFADGRYFEASQAGVTEMGQDAFLTFDAGMSDPYQFINGLAAGERFEVHLALERRADQAELSLELYSWDGMSNQFVLEAQGNPDASHQVVSHVYTAGAYMFPMVRVEGAGEIPAHRMFATAGRLHFSQARGSLANPAGIPGVISVGAVDAGLYLDGLSPEAYSSQGGGMFGLELSLCGPTNCTTETDGPQGFTGTSAAAANVAGLLALQLADNGLSKDPLGLLRYLPVGDADSAGAGVVMTLVDDFEDDNSADRSFNLGNGAHPAEGRTLSPGTDEDWFRFSLESSMNVEVVIAGAQAKVQVLDQDLTVVPMYDATTGQARALAAGAYYIRVSASGAVSPGYSLLINQFQGAPDAPEVLTPAGNVLVTEHVVELSWTAAVGPGSVLYQLQVALDAGFKDLVVSQPVEDVRIAVAPDIAGLSTGEITCYWRVLAENEYGSSGWSDVAVFRQDVSNIKTLSETSAQDGVTLMSLSASDNPEAQTGPEAAGCTTGNTGPGLTLALLAVVAAAALMRARRREAR